VPGACVASAPRKVVVTDMDETLIASKSTGYVISFLVKYGAFVRLLILPLASAVLIPLSKFKRALSVRIMYFLAFRGIRVDKAQAIAASYLSDRYVQDLQDPAASAVLDADEAIIITASPTFMARPWLSRFLGVSSSNVFGCSLEERNGRFTGRSGRIPIGDTKADILREAAIGDAETVGYGDHPTDLPFMQACTRGVLVHELEDLPEGISFEAPTPFDAARLDGVASRS